MWPWKRETRAANNYTDAVLENLLTNASGAVQNATAAMEIAAGLWARGFASAVVTPDTLTTSALTPAVLSHVGRQLHRCGQAVMEIVMVRGRLTLQPVNSWVVEGGSDPADWEWTLTIPGPSGTFTRRVPASRVLNLMYSFEPARPWVGVGPLGHAATTLTLANRLETRLAEEMGQAVGSVLPVPNVATSAKLQADLRALRGELTLVEGMQSGWNDPAQAPSQRHQDWMPRRLGGNPPDAYFARSGRTCRCRYSRRAVSRSTLLEAGQGTAARESAGGNSSTGRSQPIGRIIATALAEGLDAEGLAFDWDRLGASDISGQSSCVSVARGRRHETSTKAAALSGADSPVTTRAYDAPRLDRLIEHTYTGPSPGNDPYGARDPRRRDNSAGVGVLPAIHEQAHNSRPASRWADYAPRTRGSS